MLHLARQPWVTMQVINPTRVVLSHNATKKALTKNNKDVVNFFDKGNNILTFTDPEIGNLDFVPQFIQSMEGFKFVFLAPS